MKASATEPKTKPPSEADLCAGFIAAATEKGLWTAYPETAGFDILLVRGADGFQIGIEAKLVLNLHVLSQALPRYLRDSVSEGPDCRAVLVPTGKAAGSVAWICKALGVTVISFQMTPPEYASYYTKFTPLLPRLDQRYDPMDWHEWAPVTRCPLPAYLPDVPAGMSSPVALTTWKVQAIKLAILFEERVITRADFKALELSPSRWTDPFTGWLTRVAGGYVAGPNLPDFKRQHPRNYAEIQADKASWAPERPFAKRFVGDPDPLAPPPRGCCDDVHHAPPRSPLGRLRDGRQVGRRHEGWEAARPPRGQDQ